MGGWALAVGRGPPAPGQKNLKIFFEKWTNEHSTIGLARSEITNFSVPTFEKAQEIIVILVISKNENVMYI